MHVSPMSAQQKDLHRLKGQHVGLMSAALAKQGAALMGKASTPGSGPCLPSWPRMALCCYENTNPGYSTQVVSYARLSQHMPALVTSQNTSHHKSVLIMPCH